MVVCRVGNLNNLEINMHSKDNKIYIKNVNAKFINCKADKIASYCAYYEILLLLQA